MRHLRIMPVLTVLFIFGLCGCIYPQADLVETLQHRGRIIFLAGGEENPPYLYHENGRWHGQELPLIEAIAATINLPWEIRNCRSDEEAVSLLEKNEGDLLVSGQRINLHRGRYLRYSIPYTTVATYLVVHRDLLSRYPWNGVDTLSAFVSALSLHRIGVTRYSFAHGACSSLVAKVVPFASVDAKFAALLQRRLDACILDATEYRAFFQQNPEYLLFYRGILLGDLKEQISLAVSWRREGLLRIVDAVIRTDPTSSKESE